MAFVVEEARLEDMDEIGNVLGKAYAQDPIVTQLMPGVPQSTQDAYWAKSLKDSVTKKPELRMFKAVDIPTGKIGAFMMVRYPAKEDQDEQKEDDHVPHPAGTNEALFKNWEGLMEEYKKKHMDFDKDYHVGILGTSSEYHRKGLGSKLLNRFLDDADAANARTYIQATKVGAGLYPRFGWKDVGDITTETPQGPVVTRCMMREPNAGRYGQ